MATISNEPLLLVHDENAGSSEETPSLVLNSRNLSTVLGSVGNRPISIISLVGPEKSGKSVVFGYMVKYLTAAEQDDPDWIDTNDKSKPLDDLKWTNSRQISPDTPGIWCFNRPFILNVGDDCSEVAVILLYTQTSDKGKWSGKDNATTAALAGLSILASSSTIFNVNKQIDEKCLSAVSSCISSAMQGVKFPGKRIQPLIPFQNATFLIRDWSYPTEYPFGMSGGRDYVRAERLREKLIQSKDSRMNRQVTSSVFEHVSGCLLPYPGNGAIKPSFKGSIGEMDASFIETLKDFIEEVIDVNRLALKMDVGKATMTVAEWKILLNEYINEVNGGGANGEMKGEKLLRFLGVRRNVLQGEQKEYIKVALKVYGDAWRKYGGGERKSGKEKEPEEIHKLGKKRALKAFQNEVCPQIDNDEDSDGRGSQGKVDKKVEKLLKEKLEEKYAEMKTIKERQQTERIEKIKEDIVEQYTDSMMAAFPMDGRGKLSENLVKRESKEIMETLKGEFLAKVGTAGGRLDGTREQDIRDFERRLEQAEMKFLAKIFNKQETKNEDFGKPGESFLFDFDSRSSTASASLAFNSLSFGELNGNSTCSPKKTLNTNDVNMPLEEWRRVERKVEKEGQGNGLKQLDYQSSQKKTREQQRLDEERLKETAKRLINSLKESHTINLMNKVVEGGVEDLESFNLCKVNEVMEYFAKEIQFPAKSQDFNLYKSILEDDLKSALATVKSKSRQQSRSKQQSLMKAVKEACINFEAKLESYLEDNGEGWMEGGQDELRQMGKKIMDSEFDIMNEKFGRADVTNVREEVTKEMGQIFEKLKERHQRGRMVTVQQSKKMITELKAKHVEAMKTVGSGKDLLKEHSSLKKKILDDFRKRSPIRDQTKTLNEHCSQLEQGLEQNLKEIQKRLKMQMDGESGTQLMEIQKARQFYSEEMDKHFKNHEFMLQKDLLKIHNKVCEDAKKKCSKADKALQQKLGKSLEEAFVKYEEENQMNMDVEPAIGIDLGTTFCCVSVYQKGEIKIIPNSVGTLTTPSYVLFQANGKEIVGVPAKERAYENPEGTIFDAKRILGRKFDDEKLQEDMKLWPFTVVDGGRGIPMIQVNGKKYNPEMIAAKILEQLKKDSEAYLKRPVTKAVITVPAYFTDGQKQATMDAGTMAGLDVLSILTEPVAAAMAYKLQYSHGNSDGSVGDRHILIFDLGGGTFDVAVLKTSKGHIEVLTVDGDTHLGGEDFDRNMMNFCAEEFKKKHKVDLFEGKDSPVKSVKDDVRRRLKRLQAECERQKIVLASGFTVDVRIDQICKDLDLEVTVSRAMFEKINKKLFDTTIDVVKKALDNAKVEKGQIDDIVMVGGSTKIPKIQNLLKEFFNGKELDKKINPDEAVAHGAGLMAAIKKGNVSKGEAAYTKIQDVTPMPIGVEIYGGGFSAIIPKSTKIPVKLEERYKTAHNNQTSVQITIYEGEDPIAVNNKHLGDFYLNGVPPKGAGEENIDVEMVINDQGILHVTAKCSSTGKKNTVTVTENKQRMGQQTIKRYIAERVKAA